MNHEQLRRQNWEGSWQAGPFDTDADIARLEDAEAAIEAELRYPELLARPHEAGRLADTECVMCGTDIVFVDGLCAGCRAEAWV